MDESKKTGRKPRILKKTCSGMVLTRVLKELKLDLYDVNEATGVPVTTLFDWKNGVIPSNPEQLETVINYLSQFDEKITFAYFYFGDDEDREQLRKQLKEEEKKRKSLEFENAGLKNQISFFEELRNQAKLEKSKTRSNHTVVTNRESENAG